MRRTSSTLLIFLVVVTVWQSYCRVPMTCNNKMEAMTSSVMFEGCIAQYYEPNERTSLCRGLSITQCVVYAGLNCAEDLPEKHTVDIITCMAAGSLDYMHARKCIYDACGFKM